MRISPPALLVDARAHLGEGPAWDAARGLLWWVDILAGHLHALDPAGVADRVFAVGMPLGCVAPTRSGGLVAGVRDGIAVLEVDLTAAPGVAPGTVRATTLARPEPELPGNRFNDGKCGPDGRFLAGTMDEAEVERSGSLYSCSPDGRVRRLLGGLGISNGLAWSPDGRTLFHVDTPTREIRAFDYDPATGEVSRPRIAVTVPTELGWPDGMTADAEGRLWLAMWKGAAVTVWDPQRGTLLERIPIPARNVTSCAFGGPDLSDLYVTSARKDLGPTDLAEYPASGGLFRLRTDVAGAPTFAFAD